MRTFLWNVMLALMWCVMVGSVTATSFVVGFVLAFGVTYLSPTPPADRPYHRKVRQVLGVCRFLLREVALSSLRIAHDVITPGRRTRPAVIAVPLELEEEGAVTLLANLVSLTPGTLSLDYSAERKTLYVHAMYVDDVEATRRHIKDDWERRVKEVMG